MIGRAPRWVPLLVGVFALLWIVPMIGIVVTSIRPPDEVALGWWSLDKVSVTLDAWIKVWGQYPLADAFIVSAKIAVVSTVGSMLLTPAAAYAFHFLKFPLRRTLLIIIINAFVLPQQVVIIPLFILWRQFGLIDSLFAIWIPFIGLSFAWTIFLVKNFLEDFPYELIEAAKIDGCGPIRVFFSIVLPNSLTPIAAVGILQFLYTWNALLLPILYLRSQIPLTVVLARLSGTYETNWDLRSVAAIVTTAVPLVVFLLFQRQFAAGAQTRAGAKD
jgi:ABC-type glycerol-3-phosphate transport system permease component